MSSSFLDRLVARGVGTSPASASSDLPAVGTDPGPLAGLEVEETVDAVPHAATLPPTAPRHEEPAAPTPPRLEASREQAPRSAGPAPVVPPISPPPIAVAAPAPATPAVRRAPETHAAPAPAAPATTLPHQTPDAVTPSQPATHTTTRDEPRADAPDSATGPRMPHEPPEGIRLPAPMDPAKPPEPTAPLVAAAAAPTPVQAFTPSLPLAGPVPGVPAEAAGPRAVDLGDVRQLPLVVTPSSPQPAPPPAAAPRAEVPRADVPQAATPIQGPAVEIGTIEVRLEPPAAAPPGARIPGPPPAIGFDDYASARSYLR